MTSVAEQKANMLLNQIKPASVDPCVVEWLGQAPWERCLTDSPYHHLIFADCGVPLNAQCSTFSPLEIAKILDALKLHSADTVLEVGSSGMLLTSILASVCCSVISVESDEVLHRADYHVRQQLGFKNVQCILGDSSHGWDHDTYSAVIVNGALPFIPKDLAASVVKGGRLFSVVGRGRNKQAILVEHVGQGKWCKTLLFETEQAMLQGQHGASFEF